jgi:hypothetical protein
VTVEVEVMLATFDVFGFLIDWLTDQYSSHDLQHSSAVALA